MASNDKEQAEGCNGYTTRRPTDAGPPDDRQSQLPRVDQLPTPTETIDSGSDVPFTSTHLVNDEVDNHTRKIRYYGDYELLCKIAQCSNGVVYYEARQVNLNRIVALKLIPGGLLASDEEVQRFRSDAEAAAKLDHPGIVPIFEIGQHEGRHFVSMGYMMNGRLLPERVQNGPLPPREAAELTRKVSEAISYAHSQKVIHRNLRTASVLLDQNGEPKVTALDFARMADRASGRVMSGTILGTLYYLPPERLGGTPSEVGPLSNVYSLGAILYCLLTGRPPSKAANPDDTIRQVKECEPVSVSTINPEIQRDLETICHKCLQKEPLKRYTTAQELADDLGRWLRGEPIRARAISSSEKALRWMRRNPGLSGLVMVSVVAIVCVLVLVVKTIHDSRFLTSPTEQIEIQSDMIRSQQRLADAAIENTNAAERGQAEAAVSSAEFLGRFRFWELARLMI